MIKGCFPLLLGQELFLNPTKSNNPMEDSSLLSAPESNYPLSVRQGTLARSKFVYIPTLLQRTQFVRDGPKRVFSIRTQSNPRDVYTVNTWLTFASSRSLCHCKQERDKTQFSTALLLYFRTALLQERESIKGDRRTVTDVSIAAPQVLVYPPTSSKNSEN